MGRGRGWCLFTFVAELGHIWRTLAPPCCRACSCSSMLGGYPRVVPSSRRVLLAGWILLNLNWNIHQRYAYFINVFLFIYFLL